MAFFGVLHACRYQYGAIINWRAWELTKKEGWHEKGGRKIENGNVKSHKKKKSSSLKYVRKTLEKMIERF
jgi:hypothetical protein